MNLIYSLGSISSRKLRELNTSSISELNMSEFARKEVSAPPSIWKGGIGGGIACVQVSGKALASVAVG